MGRMGLSVAGRPARVRFVWFPGRFRFVPIPGGGVFMRSGTVRKPWLPDVPDPGYSISKVRAVSLSTVMRTVTTFSGSSGSIFSGHSTRHRSPE